MTTAIRSSTSVSYTPPAQTVTPPQRVGQDSDGSKVGEIEKPKATSGAIGTIIDTKA